MKSIYRVTVHVTHMAGSQLSPDCGGAYVNVYVRAETIKIAIDLAEEQLLSDLYKPIETTIAAQLDEEEFAEEYEYDGDPSVDDLHNILSNGGVWYSAFNLYPRDSDELH